MAATDFPPILVQVKSPYGVWYIPNAYNVSGRVAQLRYHNGIDCYQTPKSEGDKTYWHSFVYPQSPMEEADYYRDNLDKAKRKWVVGRSDVLFDTVIALQWGANMTTAGDELAVVEPVPLVLPREGLKPAYFTPVTCWSSGRTYYHAASMDFIGEPYFNSLNEQGLIKRAIPELLEEGVEYDRIVEDLARLEEELALWGYGVVLAQKCTTYYVSIEGGSADEEDETFVQHFATYSAAEQEYERQRLRSGFPRANINSNLRLYLRSTTTVGDEWQYSKVLARSRYLTKAAEISLSEL